LSLESGKETQQAMERYGECRRTTQLWRPARRGSVLIIVLLLLTVLFIMGMAMLEMNVNQAKGAVLSRNGLVARQLSVSGMEDARVKLCKDMNFPPQGSIGDYCFSYSETLTFPGDFAPAGEYQVTVDLSHNDPAHNAMYDQKIMVTSIGIVRDTSGTVLARHGITAFFDTAQVVRGGSTANPYVFQYIDWQDQGRL
jgi:Tfp pilus assembly protein PilX